LRGGEDDPRADEIEPDLLHQKHDEEGDDAELDRGGAE
jgi:hypothetical protein